LNIIILQHIKIEDPGYIKDLMLADGFNLTTIELDEGEKIPNDLTKFDAMFCMGGPMDTWMEKDYPWLVEEKKRIKEYVVDLKKPYLGFCLGCQLLGEVVGGKVVKSNNPDIGMLNIDFSKNKDIPVIIISGHANIEMAVKSLQHGAFEFIEKPFDQERLLNFIKRAVENFNLKTQNKEYESKLFSSYELIGNSKNILNISEQIKKISITESRVLIRGPSGSGKELIARKIHKNSKRKNKPFYILNGALLDVKKYEQELFGEENQKSPKMTFDLEL